MKKPTKFAWQEFAVNVSGDLVATLRQRRFGPPLERAEGVSINLVDLSGDAPHDDEMHPDEDEIIHVLEGRFRVRLGTENPSELEVGWRRCDRTYRRVAQDPHACAMSVGHSDAGSGL